MQQRGDGLIFIPTQLKNKGTDGHQVGDVRDVTPFPLLRGMQRGGVTESFFKPFAQQRFFDRHADYPAC